MTTTRTCVVCRTGQRRPGISTHTLTRNDTTVTLLHVPADVCDNCGEAYFDGATVDVMQQMLSDAIASGTRIAIVDYAATKVA